MPYIIPKEDITLKIGRSTVTFKAGSATLATHVQFEAYERALKEQGRELAVETFGELDGVTMLVDDDPEVAAVMAEMENAGTPDEVDRDALIDDAIFELRSSGDASVLTKSTGEVKLALLKDKLGFTVTDEERDASEARLKEQGLL